MEACSGWRGCQFINLHSSPSVALRGSHCLSLMSLLLPLHAYAGHEGKSRATGEREREGKVQEGGGGGALDMFLYKCPACISQTKAPPSRFLPHFCLLCLFSFPPCCLSLTTGPVQCG